MQQRGVGKLCVFGAVIGKGEAGNIVEGIAGFARQAGFVIDLVLFKESIGWRAVVGTLITVSGVALLFLA